MDYKKTAIVIARDLECVVQGPLVDKIEAALKQARKDGYEAAIENYCDKHPTPEDIAFANER